MNGLYAGGVENNAAGMSQEQWNSQINGDWMNPNPPVTADQVAELEALEL